MAYYQWKTVPGVGAVAVARFSKRGKRMSLGPSNDDIPAAELTRALLADRDDFWSQYANEGAFDWDVTRPLAEQWPWGPADPAHVARGDAMLAEAIGEPILTDAEAATIIEQSSHSYMPFEAKHAELIGLVKDLPVSPVEPREGWQGDVFAAVDTASREPWRADGETQLSDACDAAVDACDRAETKLREVVAELVTVVPDGAA